MQNALRAGPVGDGDGLLAVNTLVGQSAGRGDRRERTEHQVGERDRVDAEVEQGATGQVGLDSRSGPPGYRCCPWSANTVMSRR